METFTKKEWSSNDIVTADDFNRIENAVLYNNEGVNDALPRIDDLEDRATALENRATTLESRTTTLESRTTTLEERTSAVEAKAQSNETDIDALESQATDIIARLDKIETDLQNLNSKVITRNNFANALGEELVSEGSTSCTIVKDGQSGTIKIVKKNSEATLIKHKYYKRTSTLETAFSFQVNISPSTFSGYKYYTYDVCDIDTAKTNNMTDTDINRFLSYTKTGGLGAYTVKAYQENNKIKCQIRLLGGGGRVPVSLYLNVNFGGINDSLCETYY